MPLALLAGSAAAVAALTSFSDGVPSRGFRAEARQVSSARSRSQVPAGLRAAIDRKLSGVAATSPAGLGVRWGSDGTVWFSPTGQARVRFGLEPESIGRFRPELVSPRGFVFGAAGASEALGHGLRAWYRDQNRGWEQGFTVRTRPAGSGQSFTIARAYRGNVQVHGDGPDAVELSDGHRTLMTYGGLRATDARGRVLPTRLTVDHGRLGLIVHDAGAAYPVTVDPLITTPAATFTGVGSEELGWAVALSADGRTAVVGAPQANGNAGTVFIFTANAAGNWSSTPAATFTVPTGGRLGQAVALSADGQTAVVGAPFAVPDNGSFDGAAYVYTAAVGNWSNNPHPSPTATFTGTGGEQLGHSAAISADGQTALVSAPYAGAGAAYIYSDSGGSWSTAAAATFTNPPGAGMSTTNSDDFGEKVALSADGQVAIVGAPLNYSNSGAAYIYTTSPAGRWSSTPVMSWIGTGGEMLGTATWLSADGRTVLVGAPLANAASGAAFVYTASGGSWSSTPTATFTGTGGEELGERLILSADGQTALVGAPQANAGNGAAFVYTASGGSWSSTPTTTFTGAGGEQLGYRGLALSADGQTLTTASPFADGSNGALYVYTSIPPVGTPYSELTLPFPASGPTSMWDPSGVAVDSAGDVFVANTNQKDIVELPAGGSASSAFVLPFPTTGPAALGFPLSLAADGPGDVFVVSSNGTVVELPAGGSASSAFALPFPSSGAGSLDGPNEVAVDAVGDVFVNNFANSTSVELPAGGSASSAITLPFPASGPGSLDHPIGVAVDASGDVFATSLDTVVELPAGGSASSAITLPFPASGPGSLAEPFGLAVDRAGDVLASNLTSNTVSELPAGGSPSSAITLPFPTSGPGSLDLPNGIAVDSAGDVFATSPGTNQVDELSPLIAQSIFWTQAGPYTYGQGPVTLHAVASSGLPVSYTVAGGDPCSVSGSTLTITGTGSCVVTAAQAGDSRYQAATSVTQTITINKAGTNLAVAAAKRSLLSATFSATLTSAFTGQPIAGQAVSFSYQGKALCHATTHTNGVASCSVFGVIVTLGPSSYAATYAGNSDYLASTGKGPL